MKLTASTTVRKIPQEVYAFWRRLENFPQFMAHVEDIAIITDTRSHWKVSSPANEPVEWDAEIIQDEPGETISWRSLDGADIKNEGSVMFSSAPGSRGTEVRVALSYDMPAGKVGELVARFLGEDPHQQIDDDLRRFKQILETGEVVRSDGAPAGKKSRGEFPQHAAQPLTESEYVEVMS